jgi:hypothetical protein
MKELNHLELEHVSGSGIVGAVVRAGAAFMAASGVGALAKKLYNKATASSDHSDEM